jgi:Protein of unknown function (DUF1120)
MILRASKIASLPLLLAGATGAYARAEPARLQVVGSIAPGASCDMRVGGGQIDLGAIDLNPDPTKPTNLAEQRVKLVIDCAAPTRYALVASSSSSGGIDDPKDFGLISESDRTPTGHLYVRIDSASDHIEGKRAFHTGADVSVDLGSASWGPSTFSTWPIARGSMAIGFVTADGSYAFPPPIKNFDTYLLINTTINPANELDRADEITVAGDLGFEIRYF